MNIANQSLTSNSEELTLEITERNTLEKIKDCAEELNDDNLEDDRLRYINKHLMNIDTTLIRNFSGLFSDCLHITDLSALSHWNVVNGTTFNAMFFDCQFLEDNEGLSNWNVSKGTNFSMMFECCGLESLSALSHWDVSNGSDFKGMFDGCDSLKDITPLVNWCIPEGYDVTNMFDDFDTDDLPKNISEDQIEWLNKNIKRHELKHECEYE